MESRQKVLNHMISDRQKILYLFFNNMPLMLLFCRKAFQLKKKISEKQNMHQRIKTTERISSFQVQEVLEFTTSRQRRLLILLSETITLQKEHRCVNFPNFPAGPCNSKVYAPKFLCPSSEMRTGYA